MKALQMVIERQEAEKRVKFEGDLKEFPMLPAGLEEVLLGKDPNSVKNVASAVMQWLKPFDEKSGKGKKVNLGKGMFLGWEVVVDKKKMVISEKLGLLKKVTSSKVSPATFINWCDMSGMASLGNGNTKGLKKEAGLTTWIGFLRFLVEWSFRVLNLDPDEYVKDGVKAGGRVELVERNLTKKVEVGKGSQPKSNVVQQMSGKDGGADNSDDDFIPRKKQTFVKPKAKTLKKRTGSEEDGSKAKEEARKRIKKAKLNKTNGGVDDSLHLGLALSISEGQAKLRKEQEEQKRKKNEQRKLASDKKEIRDRLVAFKESNKIEYIFQPHLSSFQRRLVHEIAKKLDLTSESTGEGNKRRVAVKKLQQRQDDDEEAEEEEEEEEKEEEEEEMNMEEVVMIKEISNQVFIYAHHFKVNCCIQMWDVFWFLIRFNSCTMPGQR